MAVDSPKKTVVFTDLDGTLLDASSYSFEAAVPALRLLRSKEIPLVVCSSKTKKEIEHYRKLLDNSHPFITENGGGIFIPAGYFRHDLKNYGMPWTREGMYEMISLGTRYGILRKALNDLRSEGFDIRGFGDMTAEEVSGVTGLAPEQAEMAKERYFDEPFFITGSEDRLKVLEEEIWKRGLAMTQGKFFHVLGNSDKGKAVAIVTDLYRKEFGEVATVGLGDSPNDFPMLEHVDYPVLVKKPDGSWDPGVRLEKLIKAEGIGPVGWNSALLDLLEKMRSDDCPGM
jgi:mannosyl-3-phosphoglycerate phosphatase